MWYDILKFVFENWAKIKDFFRPAKRLQKKFDSCLVLSAGDCYPLQFHLNTDQPYLQLWLKINNFSRNLSFILNGGVIEGIYVNSRSIVQNLQFVDRQDVSPLKSNNIYLKQSLNYTSINKLKEIEDIYNLEARLIIKLNIDSIKLKTQKRFNFDNIPCKLSLHKSPLTLYKETVKKEADAVQDKAFAKTPATPTEKLLTNPDDIINSLHYWLHEQTNFLSKKKVTRWYFSKIDNLLKLVPGSAKKYLPEAIKNSINNFRIEMVNEGEKTILVRFRPPQIL